MRILMINVVCGIRSTGRICTDLAAALEEQGHEVKIAYGREVVPEQFKKYAVRIGSDLDVKLHGLKARLFDGCGFGSRRATEKFIEWVKEFDPDVIHLHNLHGYYINIEVLFDYLRTCEKKIIWTLHDCWAFTGHAAFCETANCERWIAGCYDCPKKNDYPVSLFDKSTENWKKKKNLMEGIPNLTIVTPSEWLANLVRNSFLAQYPVLVIHNGVNTSVFKPTDSAVKERLGLQNKKIILGVAALWEKRKGLDDFICISKMLPAQYQVVLVGLSRKQIRHLPKSIVGIERTNSVKELVELYTAADVYVNPTYEDNYPTTNLEAIACGTPVVTFNTGGSGESAQIVIDKGNLEAVVNAVKAISTRSYNVELMSIDYEETLEKYLLLIKRRIG